MTPENEHRFRAPAWGISLALHGVAIGTVLLWAAQVRLVVPEKVFQWDVALVETMKPASQPEPIESVMSPVQPIAKVVPSSRPARVTEAAQAVRPLEHNIELPPPMTAQVSPIEQKVEVPRVREEPMESRLVEMATPVAEPTGESQDPELQPVPAESVAVASVPRLPSDVAVRPEAPTQMVKASVSGPEVVMRPRHSSRLNRHM